jgi:hypothetical protein
MVLKFLVLFITGGKQALYPALTCSSYSNNVFSVIVTYVIII